MQPIQAIAEEGPASSRTSWSSTAATRPRSTTWPCSTASRTKPDGKIIDVHRHHPRRRSARARRSRQVGLSESMNALGMDTMLRASRAVARARCSASRAERPAAATRSSSPWRTSTSTSHGDIHAVGRSQQPARRHDRFAHHARQRARHRFRSAFSWRRCVDLTTRDARDRQRPRRQAQRPAAPDGYDITVASEVMAILAPRHLAQGPARAPRPHHLGLHQGGHAADGRRHRRRRRHDGAPQGRHQAEPHAVRLERQRRAHPRRPVSPTSPRGNNSIIADRSP